MLQLHVKCATILAHSSSTRRYLLRPETVESVFIAWRVTRDPKWRQAAWDIFTALKRLQVKGGGFHGVLDVRLDVNASVSGSDNVVDEQPSYFMAETLKYLFLTFDDPERLSLDDWVSMVAALGDDFVVFCLFHANWRVQHALIDAQVFSTECHPFRLLNNHSDRLSGACQP